MSWVGLTQQRWRLGRAQRWGMPPALWVTDSRMDGRPDRRLFHARCGREGGFKAHPEFPPAPSPRPLWKPPLLAFSPYIPHSCMKDMTRVRGNWLPMNYADLDPDWLSGLVKWPGKLYECPADLELVGQQILWMTESSFIKVSIDWRIGYIY